MFSVFGGTKTPKKTTHSEEECLEEEGYGGGDVREWWHQIHV